MYHFNQYVIIILIVTVCLLSVYAQDLDTDYYYYYEGERIYLTLATDALVVKYDSKISKQQQNTILNAASIQDLQISEPTTLKEVYHLRLQRPLSKTEILDKINGLNQQAGVLFSAPVLKTFKGSPVSALVTDRFIVKFADEISSEQILEMNNRESAEIVKDLRRNTYVVRILPEANRNGLEAANHFVENYGSEIVYAEPDFIYFGLHQATVNDPLHDSQWAHENTGQTQDTDGEQDEFNFPISVSGVVDADMDVESAWDISTGSGVLIGIIDSGVDLDHPDLVSNIYSSGWDAAENDYVANDDDDFSYGGHGTAVAGIAAAVGNNGLGVAGVAYDAQILPIRIFNDFGSSASTSLIAAAIDTAWMWGADILSNSWGGSGYSSTIAEAINRAKTEGRNGNGCVIVCASGNADFHNQLDFPASLSYVITVGATNMFDEKKNPGSADGQFWWGGNYGIGLDISAPTINYTTDIAGSDGYDDGDYFSKFNGTSASTPNVSGVAALLLAHNPALSSDEVQEILEETADKIDIYPYDTPETNGYYNTRLGYGRVNAHAALQELNGNDYTPPMIAFTPLPDFVDGTAQTLAVTITDASGIATATEEPVLYYRVDNGGGFNDWLSVTDSDGPLGDVYEFSIPGQADQTQVQYYIAAKDASPQMNTGSYPFGATDGTAVGDLPPAKTFRYWFSHTNEINFSCDNVPVMISDYSPNTITSTITVDSSFSIADLNVTLNIHHTYDYDLKVILTSPVGTSVNLIGNLGGGGNNFSITTLDDEAPDLIVDNYAPFNGTFQPEYPLSVIDGEDAQGTWQLTIMDQISEDGGTLWSWDLSFHTPSPYSTPQNLYALPGDQQVILTWDGLTDDDIRQYNIYRDMTSPAVTLIDSVDTPSPPDTFYIDDNVTNEQEYFYRITAISNAGIESEFSNETRTIPGRFSWYVDVNTGNDLTGDGTSSSPWKTITNALTQVHGSGQSIFVAEGTYDANSGEEFPISMVNGVSLIGAGKDLSIIDANNFSTVITCEGISDTGVTLSGFTIMGGGGLNLGGGGGLYLSDNSNLKILNNRITENIFNDDEYGGGIYITDSSPRVEGNEIIDNQARYGSGIYMRNSSSTIFNNIFWNRTTEYWSYHVYIVNSNTIIKGNSILGDKSSSNTGRGIYLTGSSSSARIINNVISDHSREGIFISSSSVTILNNTISNNSESGMHISSSAIDSIINNIICYNGEYGIYEASSSYDPGIVSYNLFEGNVSGIYYDESTTGYYSVSILNSSIPEAENNIEGFPLFVAGDSSNYHLERCSPAIDSGDPAFPVDNEPEPNGGRINMGAYGNMAEAAITDTVGCNVVLPEELYVNAITGNNESGDGSLAAPWLTITHALNQISDTMPHTIFIAAGNYDPALGEIFPIQMKNRVSLKGAGRDSSIIDADRNDRVIECISIIDSTTTLEGLTIRNGGVSDKDGGGIFISAGSALIIKNNRISDNILNDSGDYGAGIYISNSSPLIEGNEIVNNRVQYGGSGIYMDNSSTTLIDNYLLNRTTASNSYHVHIVNSDALIEDNIILGNPSSNYTGNGIYLSGSSSSARIINNVISDHAREGIYVSDGIATIINNTISNNGRSGIYISRSEVDSIINNIISYNGIYGIYEGYSDYDPGIVSYNLFQSNISGIYFDENTAGYFTVNAMNSEIPEAENNIEGPPLFIAADSSNYHLERCSPAINSGDPDFPFDNEPEPNGGRINIGAFGNTAEATITDTVGCHIVLPGDLYVNAITGNNDSGDGSPEAPWLTITHALNQISDTMPHTIFIAAGNYDPALGEIFPIQMKNRVSLKGAGRDSSIIDADRNDRVIECISIIDSTTILEGLTIRNGGVSDKDGGGIFISAGSALIIKNNRISDNILNDSGDYGAGIYISNSSPLIEGNEIIDNRARYGSGIYMNNSSTILIENYLLNRTTSTTTYSYHLYIVNSDVLIKSNTILGNQPSNYTGRGIYLTGSSSSARIINNVISDHSHHGIYISSGSVTIINNTISNNSRSGIYTYSSEVDSIVNNIICYNGDYGVSEGYLEHDPGIVSYNLFEGNVSGIYRDEGSTNYLTATDLNSNVPEAENNLEGNPRFEDLASSDYHLRLCSPGIDTGNPALPFNNEPEPNGDRINIGAYGNTDEAAITDPLILNNPIFVENPITDCTVPEDNGSFAAADLDTIFAAPCLDDPPSYSVHSENLSINASLVGTLVQINPTNNYFGNGIIIVSATDTSDFSVSDTFTVNVRSVNDLPIINDLAEIVFQEDSSYVFDLDTLVTDVDHDTTEISWNVSFPDEILNTVGNQIRKKSESKRQENSNKLINIRTLDPEIPKGSIPKLLPINKSNLSEAHINHPKLKVKKNKPANKHSGSETMNDCAIGIQLGISDSLTISIDGLTHLVTITATQNFYGLGIPVIFTATDDSAGSDSDTTNISVLPVNDSHLILPLPEMTFNEDDTVTYAIENWMSYIIDPDQNPEQLHYSIIPGTRVSADSGNGFHQFHAPANWYGRDTLQLIVSDTAFSDSALFYVNFKSVNDPPEIKDLPESVTFDTDSTLMLNIWEFVEDVETPDSLLGYVLSATNDSLITVFDSTKGDLLLSTLSGFTGEVELNLVVTDDSSATVEDELIVIISSILDLQNPFRGIPKEFVLMQNFPNPFNPVTSIRYGLPKAVHVRLEIYNIIGQRVAVLVDEHQKAGYHLVSFDANYFASGLYIYHLKTKKFQAVRKMILVK